MEGGIVSGALEVDSGVVVSAVVSEISSTEVLLIVVVTSGEVSATVSVIADVMISLIIAEIKTQVCIFFFSWLSHGSISSSDWLVWVVILVFTIAVTTTTFSGVLGRVEFYRQTDFSHVLAWKRSPTFATDDGNWVLVFLLAGMQDFFPQHLMIYFLCLWGFDFTNSENQKLSIYWEQNIAANFKWWGTLKSI